MIFWCVPFFGAFCFGCVCRRWAAGRATAPAIPGTPALRIYSQLSGCVRRNQPVFAEVTGWAGDLSPMFIAAVFSIFLRIYLVIREVGGEYGDGVVIS